MSRPPLPMMARLVGRWQKEQMLSVVPPVAWMLNLCLLGLLVIVAWARYRGGSPEGAFEGLNHGVLSWIGATVGLLWLGAAGFLLFRRLQQPTPLRLAKRVDGVLGLPDDLLALAEWPQGRAHEWLEAGRSRTSTALERVDLPTRWPLRLGQGALSLVLCAVILTGTLAGLGWEQWNKESQRIATLEAAAQERLALAQELLEDWKEYTEIEDDPKLKELFGQSAMLQEALRKDDPREAMLELNRMEQAMASVQSQIASESIAAEAAKMAEALEAFEGMGALSAALRQKEFANAAQLAKAMEEQLAANAQGQTPLNRAAAVAEMLGDQAKTAGKAGKQALSEALGELSNAAGKAQDGRVPNGQLQSPAGKLGKEFSKEAGRQNQGRMAGMGRQQLDALRRRLQGEGKEGNPMPSLAQEGQRGRDGKGDTANGAEGGDQAGRGKGGDLHADPTGFREVDRKEGLTGQVGEGESTIRAISTNEGGVGKVQAGAGKLALSDYVELSQKAVADENLPLAHRRVIRTYFERIRPKQQPHD